MTFAEWLKALGCIYGVEEEEEGCTLRLVTSYPV